MREYDFLLTRTDTTNSFVYDKDKTVVTGYNFVLHTVHVKQDTKRM